MRGLLQVAAFVLATLCAVSSAGAASTAMQIGAASSQPVGHYEFCKSYPKECGPNRKVGMVKLTDRMWQTITDINNAVNVGIFPRTDEEAHGVPELWSYPTTEGDCEDYVLLKQYMLSREGLPRSALLITVVKQPSGDGHAVLTVRTDRGDFILDNLEDRVLEWDNTPYHFLKRQSERDSGKWVAVNDGRDMVVGSVR